MTEKWFFLRGLVREAGHWGAFLDQFRRAFPAAEAIPLDLPGNGVHFREPSPLSVKEMARAVRAEFLDRRGERNHLFALSLGAMTALEWLGQHPQDFRSAVLLNTSLRGISPLYHRLRPKNYLRIARMLLAQDPAYVERSILEMTSGRTEEFDRLAGEWTRIQESRPVSASNALRQLWAAARFRPPPEKPSTPLLLLNGAGDQLVNPACSKAIAARWGLPLHVHPTAGHDLTLDAPDWVIDRLRAFAPS